MTDDERASAALLARLRAELGADRAALDRCLRDAATARERLAATPADPAALALAAMALHGWYTGVEASLERVARLLDREVPQGERWHRELLVQATVEVPGVRPAVLPRETEQDLEALLSFRHFFRHAYGVVLDPSRIAPLLVVLDRVSPIVARSLDALDAFLAQAAPA